jgi:NAD+ kinase
MLGRFVPGPETGKIFASAVAATGKVSHTGWVKVGIMVNERKADARAAVSALRDVLRSRGIEVLLHHPAASLISSTDSFDASELAAQSDVIAVLGGDGTMLAAMEKLGGTDKPVAGINIGTLGFLTSCTENELELFADALLSGDYRTSERTLLHSVICHADGTQQEFLALNEVVLARGQTGKLVSLSARINGEILNHYRADGLIVTTPTGSTAYNLSAGGPLISPDARVFVITPICPHSLSYRSLVIDDAAEVEIIPEGSGDEPMFFTVDGRDIVQIFAGSRIQVKKSNRSFHLLRLKNRSFYEALRQKLGWRG